MLTPMKNPHGRKPQTCENFNPNLPNSTPSQKPIISSSKKPKKWTPKTPIQTKSPVAPPPPPPSNKKSSKRKAKKNQNAKRDIATENPTPSDNSDAKRDVEACELEGSSKVRKMKRLMLEEAMSSIPEAGAGRVMHLVKAFERLLSIPKEDEEGCGEGKKGKVMKWALPGFPIPPKAKAEVTEISSSSLFSSPPEFERESSPHSSVDSNGDRLNWGTSSSDSEQRSRSKSTCSSRRSWNKKLKATSQQPFKLRTEKRGRYKEEHFLNKVQEMFLEEEKQRIPVAQGLPWTTENPECLSKPFVKESTEPIDLVLHSDVRAAERAEFDFHIAERLRFIEQIKQEKERLQKLEEEEEIRRLRKELVPKAQPMPYFDKPFFPKKSLKTQTVTKEPRLRIRKTKTLEKMKQVYVQQTE